MKSSFAFLLLLMLASTAHARTNCILLAKIDTAGAVRPETREDGAGRHIPYPQIDVRQVVEVFLKAVDEGQLRLFDKAISRALLKPEQVEYIYTLEHPTPTVRVYSALKRPVPFPDMPEVFAEGVTGVLDRNGRITESTVHCR